MPFLFFRILLSHKVRAKPFLPKTAASCRSCHPFLLGPIQFVSRVINSQCTFLQKYSKFLHVFFQVKNENDVQIVDDLLHFIVACSAIKRSWNLFRWWLPKMLRKWQKLMWATVRLLLKSWRFSNEHANVHGLHGHSWSISNHQSWSTCSQQSSNKRASHWIWGLNHFVSPNCVTYV